MLTKAGIVKTAKDADVNLRQNVDYGTPVGFATVVRPSQLFKLIPGTDISITPVPRGSNDATDAGVGINDYRVDFTGTFNATGSNVTIANASTATGIVGTFPSYATSTSNIAANSTLETTLSTLQAQYNTLANALVAVNNQFQRERVKVGDVQVTFEPIQNWAADPKWLNCNGGIYNIIDQPALFAVIGTNFSLPGDAAGTFRVPNLVGSFLRGSAATTGTSVGSGGSNTDSVTLITANLPAHKHAVSLTTNDNGDHQHEIGLTEDANTDGTPAKGTLGGAPGTAFTNTTGSHSHTVAGDTQNTGSGVAFTVNTVPPYQDVFFKIRAIE